MTQLLSIITTWIIRIISSLGYGGIIFLMALNSAAIPVPSEVIMPFGGFLASIGRFQLWVVIGVGVLGNFIGSSIIYWIAYQGGRKLIEEYEHIVFVSKDELQKVENFFHRFGAITVLIGRCIPVVSTFISIPAGLSKINYWKFAIYTIIGALVWNIVLTFIGYKLGQNWMVLRNRFHNLDVIILGLIIVALVWWIWRHVKSRNAA